MRALLASAVGLALCSGDFFVFLQWVFSGLRSPWPRQRIPSSHCAVAAGGGRFSSAGIGEECASWWQKFARSQAWLLVRRSGGAGAVQGTASQIRGIDTVQILDSTHAS